MRRAACRRLAGVLPRVQRSAGQSFTQSKICVTFAEVLEESSVAEEAQRWWVVGIVLHAEGVLIEASCWVSERLLSVSGVLEASVVGALAECARSTETCSGCALRHRRLIPDGP